jgi:hypothetical protein
MRQAKHYDEATAELKRAMRGGRESLAVVSRTFQSLMSRIVEGELTDREMVEDTYEVLFRGLITLQCNIQDIQDQERKMSRIKAVGQRRRNPAYYIEDDYYDDEY